MDEIKVDSSRGLIIDRTADDFEFGASKLSATRKVLVLDGQWDEFLPPPELQRNDRGDVFGCVSYSHNNAIEILHRRFYGYEMNWDDRDLTVGSGTVPYKGNGIKKVAQWARDNGLLKEMGGLTSGMSVGEFYDWKRTFDNENEARDFLTTYELGYEWLPTCNWGQTYSSPEQMMEALLYSPIQASVDGNYQYNSDGTIGRLLNWSHEIVVYGYEKGKYWKVFDSESNEPLKFEWGYKFGYSMVHSIIKRNMKLYRKKNFPAIYALDAEDNLLVPFSDGKVAGGKMFKTIYGTSIYAQMPIEVVDELPYPIADYSLSTI